MIETETKKVKIKQPRKRWSRFINETEEERKARLTKNALDWYEKHKDDPEFKEKRRQYASDYYKKKRALKEAKSEDEIDEARKARLQKIKDRQIRKAEKQKQYREANE